MNKQKAHVLVVDDDDRLRALLQKFLRDKGFQVTTVASAREARGAIEQSLFDVMVLDVMMPGETGIELLKELKPKNRPPVLMLSAMGEADDRIRGLEVGADDYLAKPFEPKELVLRLQSILRRSQNTGVYTGSVSFGAFTFDMQTGQLIRENDTIALTSGEIGMMKLLAQQAGKPVSREDLAGTLPGVVNERSVDVHITRLRKKMEENEGRPQHLQTIRGKGYVLYAQREGQDT